MSNKKTHYLYIVFFVEDSFLISYKNKKNNVWIKEPIRWEKNGCLFISIPFTWCLPKVKKSLSGFRFYKKVYVGGTAVDLMPDYFSNLDFVENWKN